MIPAANVATKIVGTLSSRRLRTVGRKAIARCQLQKLWHKALLQQAAYSQQLTGCAGQPAQVKDAYWTIYRLGTEVEVFDEVKNRPIRRLCRNFSSEEAAENYIEAALRAYRNKIAIFDRI